MYTQQLKDAGVKVIHVVSSSQFAQKAEAAGVDAIVAEGFEAGGHNGREETTTFVLIPSVVKAVSIPVIAAGGIANGSQMAAAFALGAKGIQMGTRFIACVEASAHENFKNIVVNAKEGDTMLCLKKIVPTRLYKNKLYFKIEELENKGASVEELKQLLNDNKAKQGMFDGNLEEGMLEVGQNVALIDSILTTEKIIQQVIQEYFTTLNNLCK